MELIEDESLYVHGTRDLRGLGEHYNPPVDCTYTKPKVYDVLVHLLVQVHP